MLIVMRYMDLQFTDVHREHAIKAKQPFEEKTQLIDLVQKGDISKDEFTKRYRKLHKRATERDHSLILAVDALYSTACSYTTDPELLISGTFVDERELRRHAREVLQLLREERARRR